MLLRLAPLLFFLSPVAYAQTTYTPNPFCPEQPGNSQNNICLLGEDFEVEVHSYGIPQLPDGRPFVWPWFGDKAFWVSFGSDENPEVFGKVLDGCHFNGYYWFFGGGMTDRNVEIEVRWRAGGLKRTYTNPEGTAFSGINDTRAFPCQTKN